MNFSNASFKQAMDKVIHMMLINMFINSEINIGCGYLCVKVDKCE